MHAGERYLADLAAGLSLDRDQQQAILAEVRDHLTTAAEWWQTQGAAPEEAWQQAVTEFGPVDEVIAGFVETRRGWGTNEAVAAAAVPVALALLFKLVLLPVLAISPSWSVLAQPALFWTAVLLLLLPLVWPSERWRYGLVVWILFWFFALIGAGA